MPTLGSRKWVLALLLMVGAGGVAGQRSPDLSALGRLELGTITADEGLRGYWVYTPAGFDGSGSWPAVIVFHGGGGRGRQIMAAGEWREAADTHGFIAVFPDGTSEDTDLPLRRRRDGQTWNDGSGRQTLDAVQRGADDIGFVDRMLDDLLAEYPVDPNRVFASGHSNGASMAFHAARELDGRFAAIAPVAGSDFADAAPTPVRPISVVYITGTADPINPMAGGLVSIPPFIGPFTKPAVLPMVRRWAEAQQCAMPSTLSEDLPGVETRTWSDCAGGVEIVLHAIEGHGHTWPGAERELPVFLVGPDNSAVSATAVISGFFADRF